MSKEQPFNPYKPFKTIKKPEDVYIQLNLNVTKIIGYISFLTAIFGSFSILISIFCKYLLTTEQIQLKILELKISSLNTSCFLLPIAFITFFVYILLKGDTNPPEF